MTVAASFGLASALSVVVLGDESGYTATQNQKMKIAAIEAMWHTEPAPAGFTVVRLPGPGRTPPATRSRVPWVLGLIATRSLDTPVPGIDAAGRHASGSSGMIAYGALRAGLGPNPGDRRGARRASTPMSRIWATACCSSATPTR